jgi:hypothetical protein
VTVSRPYGAIRKGHLKLIEFFETGKVQMFDVVQELRDLLHAWRRDVGAQMPSAHPNYRK